jgi:hypothetical protein
MYWQDCCILRPLYKDTLITNEFTDKIQHFPPPRKLIPPLCSSCQTSWLQIQRSGFDSWRYQIFREVVGLERGLLSLVSTIEELLGRKSSVSGLEIEITAVGIRHAYLVAPSFRKS